MAARFWGRSPRSFRRISKRSWLLFAAFLLFLWTRLPNPHKSNTKHTPLHEVADKPRFLYHSHFRDHADYEYEATIDNLLRNIEDAALSHTDGNVDATDTIWQIHLGDEGKPIVRGKDSLKFERKNDDWEYKAGSAPF